MNKQELIKEYESIVKDDSLDLCGCYNMGDKIFMRKIYKSVLEDLEQLDEPQKIKLKDVIARIQKLDLGTQKVWLSEILNELGSDYGTLKYKDGYEQGKFDCAMEREKVTIPQFVADYIEESRLKGWDLLASMCFVLNAKNKKTTKWFYLGENKNIFALAWINGYTVEEEKRYSVKIKGKVEENLLVYGLGINRYFFARTYDSSKRNGHTRKELEEDGFGWVFDCPGIEVEEVEE